MKLKIVYLSSFFLLFTGVVFATSIESEDVSPKVTGSPVIEQVGTIVGKGITIQEKEAIIQVKIDSLTLSLNRLLSVEISDPRIASLKDYYIRYRAGFELLMKNVSTETNINEAIWLVHQAHNMFSEW